MANAILGSKGFIGSRLKWYADNFLLGSEWIGINIDNYDLWKGHSFNKLIWAAGMSSKPQCDEDKDACFEANVTKVAQAIKDFSPRKFIYLSSFDVYPSADDTKEETADDIALFSAEFNGISRYGQTKLQGERCAKEAQSFLIFRCNGFTGPGLKKNVVYDIANDETVWVSLDSKFQYMHTDAFAHLLFQMIGLFYDEVFNFTSAVSITPMHIASFLGKDIKKIKQPTDKVVPHVSAVLDTSKLSRAAAEHRLYFPTSEEAVRFYNEPIKIPMYRLREPFDCRFDEGVYRLHPGKPRSF